MIVNEVDFLNATKKYLNLAQEEEIVISSKEKLMFKIVMIKDSTASITDRLAGKYNRLKNIDMEQVYEERQKKYESID